MLHLRIFLTLALLFVVAASSVVTASGVDVYNKNSPSSSFGSVLSQELTQKATQHLSETLQQKLKEELIQKGRENSDNNSLRNLQASTTEDFDQFRELFSKATINLPDFESSETILFSDFNLRAFNVKCMDIYLGDIQISYALETAQRLTYRFDINDLDLRCTLNYAWSFTFFDGEGEAEITLNDNYASSTIVFTSPDFSLFPPTNSTTEACQADITITDMEFSGTVVDQVLNLFESLLRGFIESTVSETVCEELGALGSTLVQDFIEVVANLLNPFLKPVENVNATTAEAQLLVPDNIRLMNFQDEGDDQTWFYSALQEVDSALGVWLIDPRTEEKDLGVNIFLRENLLDENGALELAIEDLPFDFDPVLFEGHDSLTETTIRLDMVRVYGLDTFREFAPFVNEGKYTLTNNLAWEFLSFELDVTLDMKPSSLEDSIIEPSDQDDMHIVEKVKMTIGVDDINATLSALLAIDQDAFGALKMGPLLVTDNLLPCFWSSVFKSEVTKLQTYIGNIQEPTITGFIDKGIDNVVTQSVYAAFLMYESIVIKAMPNIFQITIRDLVNEAFFHTYKDPCPEPKQIEGLIDFRDLLEAPEDAILLGGSGTEPYGSLASTLFSFLLTQIATVDEDGTLSANDMFIRPLTENGTIVLAGDLMSVSAGDLDFSGLDALLEGLEISLADLQARNLDTLVPPLEILQPTKDPYALDNEIHFGPIEGRPLNISARFSLKLGENSPFSMDNQIDVSMASSAFEALAQVLARVEANAIMNYPIEDLLNFDCWLATIAAPTLNEFGLRVDPDEDRGIELTEFSNKFTDLNVVVECVSCTTNGLSLIPDVLDVLRQTDVTSILASRLRFAVQDVLVSDSFKTFLDRMLFESGMQCPHSPRYTADASVVSDNYASLPFPALSETSIDTAHFVLGTILHTGFVVFTQMYSQTEVDPEDALARQNSFDIPEGSDLINFTDFSSGLPSIIDSALDKAFEMVQGRQIDPATGNEDLAVNIFIRDFFGSGGVLDVGLDGLSFGPDEFKFEIHSIRVEGLDTFRKFDVGVPAAPQTILNDVEMETLAVEIELGLYSNGLTQKVKAGFRFEDLTASIPLFAAIDKDLLKRVQVGSLLNLPNVLSCLLSSVHGFSFPHMVVRVGKIHKPTVEGLMAETSASLTTLVDTLFLRYNATMHDSLPSVFDNALRPVVNSMLEYFIKENSQGCSNPLLESLEASRRLMKLAGPPFVDFRDLLLSAAKSQLLGGRGDSRYGDLFRTVWDLVKSEFLYAEDEDGETPVNSEVITSLTEDGDLFFPGDILNNDIDLTFGPIPAGVAFRVADARIENLDTIGQPFSILDPVLDRPSLLNNTVTLGVGKPLRIGSKVVIDITSGGETVRNDFDISADLHGLTVVLAALLKISEYRFAAFPIGDAFNLDCWLATIPPPALDKFGVREGGVDPTAAMDDLAVAMKKLNLNITCNVCSSQGLKELAELWSTPEATEEVTDTVNDLLEYLGNLLGGGLVQNQLDRMLHDAAKRCPHSPEYDSSFTSFTYQPFKLTSEEDGLSLAITLMIVAACVVSAVLVLIFAIRTIVRRRHKRWLKTLPKAQLMLLKTRQETEEEKERELNEITQSLFTSCDVPLLVRWLVPVIILGNIAFFLSGHLSLGAEVKIQLKFAGQLLEIDQFYQFSMARSTVEIWQAGGKALAILILLFSGVWPYTKQLISLTLWFLPPSRCSISRRGSILLWLDTLAKWSIVDIFTLVVSIAAFRVSVGSPDVAFLTDDLYSLDLLVVPMWGLYANLLAQLISQISSHFIIHYHRNIVHVATKVYKTRHGLIAASTRNLEITESSDSSSDASSDCPYGNREDPLHQHAYARPHRGESGKLIARSYVNGVVTVGAVALMVLLITGCVLPSTGIEFFGILGIAVESGQGFSEAVTSLSLFDLMNLLMDQARFTGQAKDFAGMGLLCALLVITVLLVPLVQTATLLYQWFKPMTGFKRKRLAIAVECLQAWQYMEVYVISIVVATWQLGPLSQFMINGYCEDFEETFDLLAYFGMLKKEDAQCFRVDARIESACYILAAAAVLLSLLNTFVMNALRQYFRDRDAVISREEFKERMFIQQEEAQSMNSTPCKVPSEREGEPSTLSIDKDSFVSKGRVSFLEPTMIVETLEEYEDADYGESRQEAEEYINPVPVLFTDKFRWMLRPATPVEELNGAIPEPPLNELTEKPSRMATSDVSLSDDEQPTPQEFSPKKFKNEDPDQSVVSSVYLDDSRDGLPKAGGPETVSFKSTLASGTAEEFRSYPLDDEVVL